jgi:hypothetical protein
MSRSILKLFTGQGHWEFFSLHPISRTFVGGGGHTHTHTHTPDLICAEESFVAVYEGVSKSFRTESVTNYTLTTINTRWEATKRVMAEKLTRLTHKIAIQLHLVAQSCAHLQFSLQAASTETFGYTLVGWRTYLDLVLRLKWMMLCNLTCLRTLSCCGSSTLYVNVIGDQCVIFRFLVISEHANNANIKLVCPEDK